MIQATSTFFSERKFSSSISWVGPESTGVPVHYSNLSHFGCLRMEVGRFAAPGGHLFARRELVRCHRGRRDSTAGRELGVGKLDMEPNEGCVLSSYRPLGRGLFTEAALG